ncbi:LysR family transcriptional regulator [Pararhizobium antarcticum]|uniref:LysR family transcriptional regulator n=1 Tax=Pararhizobium antarcticum TaxID=1798805 RepID=A0A657LQ69_9HYPH|nr:LysR family transcriptional regulator [Pararhizobium antarcticum]OJF93439.1 LysR family transcriptional regulator [Pararhizobium antarcticum]OJG00457.1 LysR family transcriptional regulator [Rhizobium sp. 58]
MNEVDWDDLKLFFQVASEGGLAGAAAVAGLSAPTIGRRMLALERTMGRSLFMRSQQGYRLAPDGEVLLLHVETLRKTVSDITRWHGDAFTLPIVSIGGDIWLGGFVAERAMELRGKTDGFRLCCKRLLPDDNLTFRHGMIAMFYEQPQSGNFAVSKSVTMAYCVYRAEDERWNTDLPWISIGTEVAASSAEKWVFRNHEQDIHSWTNAPELLPKLIAAGAGRGVLPIFLGDTLPGLIRDGEPIAELTHPVWLTVNDDDRQRPEVRLTLDRLTDLLRRNAALFSGQEAKTARQPIALTAVPRL